MLAKEPDLQLTSHCDLEETSFPEDAILRVENAYTSTDIQTEESDPLRTEVASFADEVDFRYLAALESAIQQQEFRVELSNLSAPLSTIFESDEENSRDGYTSRRKQFASYLRHAQNNRELKARQERSRKNSAIVSALRVQTFLSPTDETEEVAHSASTKTTNLDLDPCSLSDYWERLGPHEGLGYGTTVTRYAQMQELKEWVAAPPKRLSGSASRAKRRADDAHAKILSHSPDSDDQRVAVFTAATFDAQDQRVPLIVQMDKSAFDKLSDAQVAALAASTTSEEVRAAVDSGTTVTITNIPPSKLERFDVNGRKFIKGFDGRVTESLGEGVIVGSMLNGDKVPKPIIIPKAQCVPNAPTNLLSVSNMTKMSYEFHFTKARSWIVTPDLDVIELEEKNGLYWITWRPVPMQSTAAATETVEADIASSQPRDATIACAEPGAPYEDELDEPLSEDALSNGGLHDELSTEHSTRSNLSCHKLGFDTTNLSGGSTTVSLLHRRLGHFSNRSLTKLAKDHNIKVEKGDEDRLICTSCAKCKAHSFPVPKNREQETRESFKTPFARVWTDLKGKVSKDLYGNKYLITFTCDHTRFTRVYFMKRKSEAVDKLRLYLGWVERMGFSVQQVNCDGGGEYTSGEKAKHLGRFETACEEAKVEIQFTSPYTPSQNGVSERLNRTIIEGVRTMLHDSALSHRLWSFAAEHFIYVRNRLNHPAAKSSDGKPITPYEMVYGRTPSYSNLRVWGSDAYVLKHNQAKGTFEPKANSQIFVGISPQRKGWLVMDPLTHAVRTSTHCGFDENFEGRRDHLTGLDMRIKTPRHFPNKSSLELAQKVRELYEDGSALSFDCELKCRFNEKNEVRFYELEQAFQNLILAKDFLASELQPMLKPHIHHKYSKGRKRKISKKFSVEELKGINKRYSSPEFTERLKDKQCTILPAPTDQPSPPKPTHVPSPDALESPSLDSDDVSYPMADDREHEQQRPRRSARVQVSTNPVSPTAPQPSTAPDQRIPVPVRELPVGQPQQISAEDKQFLEYALALDLPLRFVQQNQKRGASRQRYERYKRATTLRDAKLMGGTWSEIKWDYERGFIDFTPTAERATHADLIEEWLQRDIAISATATISDSGDMIFSHPFNSNSPEEVFRTELAGIGLEFVEQLSHRAQRYLTASLSGKTLTEYAHSCASRIIFKDPLTYKEAMEGPNAEDWQKAMAEEIDSLIKLGCFELVPKSEAQRHGKLVKSKWVYKTKVDEHGNIERRKGRLVAKGFTQIPGQDFFETYSPVFSYTTFRTSLALAAQNDWYISQFDIKNAFIQQKLDVEHLHLAIPQGMSQFMPDGKTPASLRLNQSIYGLKQSSRLLYERMKRFLTKLGFKTCISDKCCFTRGTGSSQQMVLVYVDDILFFNHKSDTSGREQFNKVLADEFVLSPWTKGEANWILNCKVNRNWEEGTISVSQEVAITKLLSRFGIGEHDKSSIPMRSDLKLRKANDEEVVSSREFEYSGLVGALLYLSLTCRPDIAQAVGVLSRYMARPSREHCDAALLVLKYLNGTKTHQLTYRRDGNSAPHIFVHTRKSKFTLDNTDKCEDSPPLLRAYADADLAGDVDSRRSTNGNAIMLAGGIVHWQSKLQSVTALSTAEAETYASIEAVKTLVHLRLLLRELGLTQKEPTVVYEDNAAAISLATGTEQSKRARHYQMKVAWICEHYDRGTFVYEKVTTKQQLADIFTKALPRDDFERYRNWMGVLSPHDLKYDGYESSVLK